MKALTDILQPLQKVNIIRNIIPEDGEFPNNPLLPILLYKQVFEEHYAGDAALVREILETNSWSNSWVDGILDKHHFHSNTHEALVALDGSARVQLGGPNGISVDFEKGDVLVIPAGVAHKRVDDVGGFSCMGAYPDGRDYDMNYGESQNRVAVIERIRNIPSPENDPVYGGDGPLIKNWGAGGNPVSVL